MSAVSPNSSRLTLRDIRARYREGQRLAMLTAYDAITAALLDRAEVDLLLVGDSVGNTVLGFDNTLPVTLDDMIRHTSAVVRGSRRALVVLDLPFGTTTDPETTLRASVRAIKETGCQAVKLEGGIRAAPIVQRLVAEGIPVMGHIGLTPQAIHQLGGYSRHGKSQDEANELKKAARALENAGAFSVVLECVVPEVARAITETLDIPTIGIGSGDVCSGEVLVVNDLIGLGVNPPPSFARPRADVGAAITAAAAAFAAETRGVRSAKPTKKDRRELARS